MKYKTKNKNDLRYIKTENKLLDALSQVARRRTINVQIQEICSLAGIKRPTFYYHYHNINHAISEVEKKLFEQFQNFFKAKQPTSVKEIYSSLLFFIFKNQVYFTTSSKRHNYRLLLRILDYLRPQLTLDWRNYDKCVQNQIFISFCGSIIVTVNFWLQNNQLDLTNFSSQARYLATLTSIFQEKQAQLAL